MRLDNRFASLGFLTLSVNVQMGAYALPIRAADLRQPVEGMLIARRPTYAEVEGGGQRDLPLVKRSRPAKRGYYVGPIDPGSSSSTARRDRFAPIGYPVRGLVRRGGDDDVKDAGAAVADRKSTDGGGHPAAPDAAHPSAPDTAHPPPPAAPNADSRADDKSAAGQGDKDGDKGSVKLPADVKISSPGFLFIPLESAKTAAAGKGGDAGKVSATQSSSHQTYFINVEAPVVNGPPADDAKDDQDKKDNGKKGDPKSTGTDHDQTKIIFKPLKDSDGKSNGGGGGGAAKAQPDSSSNPHPPSSTNKDVTDPSNAKPATDDKSGDPSTTPAAAAPATPAVATSPQAPKAGGDDDYYLFPVTQEHEQVDLSKGDMIAYVDHPSAQPKTSPAAPAAAAPPSTPPGPASVPSSASPPAAPILPASSPSNAPNATGGPPPVPAGSAPDPNSSSKRRDVADDGGSVSFRRMIKRALVPGERDARIGYWTGQELNRKRFDAGSASVMISRIR